MAELRNFYATREVCTWVLQGRHLYCHSQSTHSSGEDYPMYLLWNSVGSPWFPSSNAFPLGGNELLKGDISMLLQHKIGRVFMRHEIIHVSTLLSLLTTILTSLFTSPSVNILQNVQPSSGWYVGRFIPAFRETYCFLLQRTEQEVPPKHWCLSTKACISYPGRQSSDSVS